MPAATDTPLADLLRQLITQHGPIPVDDYVAHCLYHPEHGYYTRGHNFLPAPQQGSNTPYPHDFTTAPELTPLFGATLANWLATEWAAQGSPTPFTLMEAGPGRGTLMHSLLSHLQTAHPVCYAAAQPLLIETSPHLTQLQQTTLTQYPQCQWQATPTTLQPYNPVILVANELLDAFPHQQNIIQISSPAQRAVSLSGTNEFILTPDTGQIDESSPSMQHWLSTLPQTVIAVLFLDYGASTTGPTGDTLQAIHRHQKVSIFHLPGQTDLTHHVNFAHVTTALARSHPTLNAAPLEDLSPFLLRHGLASLALATEPHPGMDTALHRLLHPAQMGTLFKVQCLRKS